MVKIPPPPLPSQYYLEVLYPKTMRVDEKRKRGKERNELKDRQMGVRKFSHNPLNKDKKTFSKPLNNISDGILLFQASYCKDATNTGYRIRPGPSKMKSRFNPSLTPESACKITKKEEQT